MNNGVLPVVVSEDFLAEIFESNKKDPKNTVTVDLETQTITNNGTGKKENFDINSYKKNCLLNGYDDIDYLLSKKEEIVGYETQHPGL